MILIRSLSYQIQWISILLRKIKLMKRLAEEYTNKFVMIYTGRIDLNVVLKSPMLSSRVILKKNSRDFVDYTWKWSFGESLTELAKENKVEEFIRFIPWAGHEKVNSYLSFASVCYNSTAKQ